MKRIKEMRVTDNIRKDFVTHYSNSYNKIQDVRTLNFINILYRAYMGYLCLSNGIGIIRHWVAPQKRKEKDDK